MKHKSLLAVLFLFAIINASSQELDTSEYKDQFFIDVGLKLLLPTNPEIESLVFFDFSANFGLSIIPRRYYLGIGVDAGIGLDWFQIFSEETEEEKEKNKDKEYRQFGLSLGVRAYNLIKIGHFYLAPFIGCDFLFIIIPMPYTGIQIGYKIFSIEYGYYFPIYNGTMHQISIKIEASAILK
jgi:hypothetical protein